MKIPDGISREIIIVDNNSKDNTRQIVENFQSRLPIRYFLEKKQGKTYALNRALEVAEGDLILFTDDDTVLHPEWAGAFLEAASSVKNAGWFGGHSIPLWTNGRPLWLKDDCMPILGGYFCLYDLGPDARFYQEKDLLPIGASMAVRRSTFNRIGKFREDLGPRGEKRGVGDDTELIMRAIDYGIKGYYVPEAIVEHLVPHERLSYSAFFRYGIKKGEDQHIMEGKKNTGALYRATTQIIRALPQLLKNRRDRVRICLLNAGMEIGRIKAVKIKIS